MELSKKDTFIFDRLTEQKKEVNEFLKEHSIFNTDNFLPIAIFAKGSMNYNLFNPEKSDVDSIVIMCPKIEGTFLPTPPVCNFETSKKEFCTIVDIRHFYSLLGKEAISMYEVLEFRYVIPMTGILFKYWDTFFGNEESYAMAYSGNYIKFIKSLCGCGLSLLKDNRNMNKKYSTASFFKMLIDETLATKVLTPFLIRTITILKEDEINNLYDIKFSDENEISNEDIKNLINYFQDVLKEVDKTESIDKDNLLRKKCLREECFKRLFVKLVSIATIL